MQATEVLCNWGEFGNSLREGEKSEMGYLDVLCNEQHPSMIDKVSHGLLGSRSISSQNTASDLKMLGRKNSHHSNLRSGSQVLPRVCHKCWRILWTCTLLFRPPIGRTYVIYGLGRLRQVTTLDHGNVAGIFGRVHCNLGNGTTSIRQTLTGSTYIWRSIVSIFLFCASSHLIINIPHMGHYKRFDCT